MRGIRMEKDTILYYGNAAGYISNDKAVVDPLFQSKELQDFLDRQKDVTEVKWVNGTFDRLTNGRLSLHSSRDPDYTKYCHTVARVAGIAVPKPMILRARIVCADSAFAFGSSNRMWISG